MAAAGQHLPLAVDPLHGQDGLAVYPASGTTMNELFRAADVALYEARNAGRHLVRPHPSPIPATTFIAQPL